MKLTNESIDYFSFIKQNYKELLKYRFSKETKHILHKLNKKVDESYKKYNNILHHYPSYFDIATHHNDIQYPVQFKDTDFPREAIYEIRQTITKQKCYKFKLKGRTIKIYIGMTENENEPLNKYIEKIIMWLHVLSQYSSHKCSQELSIYIYMTHLKKQLPESKEQVLDWINVNTAFTRSCRPQSELVIYRKEEWFKVLIHETFHCFGLDFSSMYKTNSIVMKHMKEIFNVNVDILLFESYTEIWAELWNILFFNYLDNPKANQTHLEQLMNYEQIHSVLQMNKILSFMNLNYDSLIHRNSNSKYKENTNVFAYYVLKSIIYCHLNEFMSWCENNNPNILQFEQSVEKVESFCHFIKENYISKTFAQVNKKKQYSDNYLQMSVYDFA